MSAASERRWLTLSQLAGMVRTLVADWSRARGEILVVAEVSEIRRGPTGHHYLRLVERTDDGVVAEMQAVLWVGSRGALDTFKAATGTPVAAGMQLLLIGSVDYHERYGLKFTVHDIDPTYSLGEMQRRRHEVIRRLTDEGLIESNRRRPMPLVPLRIAVVSSSNAAGYQDFVHELGANTYGYRFTHRLFAAGMQGDAAESSISGAFARIRPLADLFDAVVVLRGGGSQVDLSCFDTYGVGAAIGSCWLPVLTGVGHERDVTVADMAAHTRAKTPTAAAQVLIERVRRYEERVEEAWTAIVSNITVQLESAAPKADLLAARLVGRSREVLSEAAAACGELVTRLSGRTIALLAGQGDYLSARSQKLATVPAVAMVRSLGDVDRLSAFLVLRAGALVERNEGTLDRYARDLHQLDPTQVLRRGFSITRYQGRALTSADQVHAGAEIATVLTSGALRSTVTAKEDSVA